MNSRERIPHTSLCNIDRYTREGKNRYTKALAQNVYTKKKVPHDRKQVRTCWPQNYHGLDTLDRVEPNTNLRRVIPTLAFHDICLNIYSGFLPNILSDIYSDSLCGIVFDMYSDILSGILSDLLWRSNWHPFWHFIWHSLWHSLQLGKWTGRWH